LQIWDTCGQEAYRSLITSFYRNASLAILVYSIDNQNSYNNIEAWLNEIKSQSNPETKTFLIGNKIDLENERKIPKELAQQFCKDHGFNYFEETSAKNDINAKTVFINAAKELYLSHLEYKDRASRLGSMEPSSYQQNSNFNNNVIKFGIKAKISLSVFDLFWSFIEATLTKRVRSLKYKEYNNARK